jgi:bacterioferritin-associated ferredoxin
MVVLVEQDAVICQCLQVSESKLAEAGERCSLGSLQDVARETGAGSGCMSCHRVLRRWINQRRGASAGANQGAGSQSMGDCPGSDACGGSCYSSLGS